MTTESSPPIPVVPSENADAGAASEEGAPTKTKGRAELDLVCLSRPVKANFQPGEDGFATSREIPAGAIGTIVAVWDHGEAYEVEFSEPFAALATVEAADLGATDLGATHHDLSAAIQSRDFAAADALAAWGATVAITSDGMMCGEPFHLVGGLGGFHLLRKAVEPDPATGLALYPSLARAIISAMPEIGTVELNIAIHGIGSQDPRTNSQINDLFDAGAKPSLFTLVANDYYRKRITDLLILDGVDTATADVSAVVKSWVTSGSDNRLHAPIPSTPGTTPITTPDTRRSKLR